MKRLPIVLAFLLLATRLAAQTAEAGSVVGSVIDQVSGQPIEYATLELKKKTGNDTVGSAITDSHGAFAVENVPFGDYRAFYGSLGADSLETPPFTIDAQHRTVDLGRLIIGNTAIKMEKFEITSRREAFSNSIDRKVYNIGTDIQSATGSVSNLLSNVPSVEVGVEGDVSLRGNSNFLMLVDGKPSTLMNTANRATALEQMPADSIDKIEVITNPSAKYTPNGTAGIINITLKRKREAGYSATVRANVGNDSRYSFGLTANYNPGKYNLYGAVNVRQDYRPRYTQENRSHLDSATNTVVSTAQATFEHSRPLSRLAQLGADYKVDDATKLGASVNYNYRTFFRRAIVSNLSRDASGNVTSDYDRTRVDPEWQKTVEFATTYQHSFPKEGHELDLELKHDRHWEQEDNHYSDIYRTPVTPPSFDYTLIKPTETSSELTADYTYPLDNDGKLDAGYSLQVDKSDMNFQGGFLDSGSGLWVVDATTTNRFIYRDHIHAFYATYGQPIGKFGFLAGLRVEQALAPELQPHRDQPISVKLQPSHPPPRDGRFEPVSRVSGSLQPPCRQSEPAARGNALHRIWLPV
jgi:outer membrane receptor protein involved in Fe transport